MKTATRTLFASLKLSLAVLALMLIGFSAVRWSARAARQEGARNQIEARAQAWRQRCRLPRYATATNEWMPESPTKAEAAPEVAAEAAARRWQSLGPMDYGTAAEPCEAETTERSALPDEPEYERFVAGALMARGQWLYGLTEKHGMWRGAAHRDSFLWQYLWQYRGNRYGNALAVDASDKPALYLVSAKPLVSKSLDGGDEFTAANEGLSEKALTAPLLIDTNDAQRVWAGGRFVWRTLDGAAHWRQASAALPGSDANRVSALAVSAANSSFALAGTSEGYILRTHDAFNANAASEWAAVRPRAGKVSSLTFDPYNANTAYATYAEENGAQVWRTRDAGASWESVQGALPDAAAHSLIVDPANPARLYLATEIGLFVSLDAGASWAVEVTGFGATPVTALTLDQQSEQTSLYSFTHGRGVWRVSLNASANTAQQCTYTIAPVSLRFDAAGGAGSVNVTTQANCAWTVTNANAWVTITSGASGSGNGMVSFNVTANATRDLRTGTLTIAGRTFTIEQTGQGGNCVTTPLLPEQTVTGTLAAGDCLSTSGSYRNSFADRYTFNAQAGQLVAFTMTTTGGNYIPYLYLIGPSGSNTAFDSGFNNTTNGVARIPQGAAYFTVTVAGAYTLEAVARDPNTTGDYRLSFVSLPVGCSVYTVTPARRSFEAAGGGSTVQVSVAGQCPWTATTSADWLTVPGGAAGLGSMPMSFTVAANTGAYRTGTISIGTQSITVEQAGAGSNCLPVALTIGQSVEGSLTTADCRSTLRPVGSSATPTDRYVFSAQAGQRLNVSLTTRGLVPVSWYFYLLKAGGAVLGETDDRGSFARNDFTIPATGDYVLEVTTRGIANRDDYALTVNLTQPGCGYALNPTQQTFEATGGNGSFAVQASAGCEWTAHPDSSWITVTSGAETVSYSVAANSTTSFRRGAINVGGRVYLIEQAGVNGSCAARAVTLGTPISDALSQADCRSRLRVNTSSIFSPIAKRFAFSGTAGQQVSVRVTSTLQTLYLYLTDERGRILSEAQTSFPLNNAAATLPTLALPANGTYILEATMELPNNSNASNFSLQIDSLPSGCNFRVTAPTNGYEAASGPGSLSVAAQGGCAWTAQSLTSWLTITESANSGSGAVRFTLAANTASVARRATMLVAGQTLSVTQAGFNGRCAPRTLALNATASGTLSNGDCLPRFTSQGFGFAIFGHVYTLALTAGDAVTFNLTGTTATGASGVVLADANDRVLLSGSGRLPTTGSFIVPATGVYQLEIAGPSGTGYQVTTSNVVSNCRFALSAAEQVFDGAGGTGSVVVTTTDGCQWQATASIDSVTITSGASGSGNGTIAFTVAANTGFGVRTATINVAGSVFTITQAGSTGSCLPRELAVGATVTSALDQGDCRARYRPSNNNSIIAETYRIAFVEGQQFALSVANAQFQPTLTLHDANGVVLAEVNSAATFGTTRLPQTGLITLPATGDYFVELSTFSGGQGNYTLSYEPAAACTTSLLPAFRLFDSEGGTGAFRVVTGANCNWSVTLANTPWVSFTGSTSGMGNGTVNFSVAANSNGLTRRATLNVNGTSLVVDQSGANGNCAARPLAFNQLMAGVLNSADCPARLTQNLNVSPPTTTYADRYTFTAAAGDRVAVQAIPTATPTNSNEISLLDPLGRRISTSQFILGPFDNSSLVTLNTAGTYQLELAMLVNSTTPPAGYNLIAFHVPAGCTYELGAALQTFPASGGAGSSTVTASGTCPWTALTSASWITLANPTGTGNGTMNFTVAPNTTAVARSGVIYLGDKSVIIAQGGAGNDCSVVPLAPGQTVNGTLNESDCLVGLNPNNTTTRLRADRYSFNGKAGEQVVLDVFGVAQNSLGLNLFAPDGSVLARNVNTIGTTGRVPFNGWQTLPADGTYLVEIFNYQSSGNVAEYRVLLTQTPALCSYGLTATTQSFDATGGTGSVSVLTAAAACAWTAATSVPWVTVNAPTSGSGNGTVNFTVAANTTNAYRSTPVLIAGQSFLVDQAPAGGTCTPQPITPNVALIGTLGPGDCRSQFRINNNTFPFADRYRFTAQAGQQVRLHMQSLNGGSIVGLYYLLDANGVVLAQGPSLTNLITVPLAAFTPETGALALPGAGTYFIEIASNNPSPFNYQLTVLLNPASCAFSLSPTRRTFNGAGNAQSSFTVTTGASCNWVATSPAAWMTLAGANTSGAVAGTGGGTVNFTIADNATAEARAGTITLGDQTFTITQGGSGSSCLPLALTLGQTVNGEFSFGDCQWRMRQFNSSNNQYADAYTFSGRAGDRLQVTLTLPDTSLRPFLALSDPNEGLLLQTSSNNLPSDTREFRLPASGFYTLPVTGTYLLEAINPFGSGRYSLVVNLAAACSYTVATTPHVLEATGGTREIALQTTADCPWLLASNVPWITTNTNGARGAGNGTAAFTVAPNPDAMPRTATLTLGGATITVTQVGRTAITSAASYATDVFAPDSIAAMFGQGLASATAVAQSVPLPTRLANATVRVRDSRNVTHNAQLFAVSPTQINFLIPAQAALGKATVIVAVNDTDIASSEIMLAALAPGLFSANADGRGVPAGLVLRVRNDAQSFEPLARFDQATGRFVAVPIDLGSASDDVFLILFGTGFRARAQNSSVAATIGAEPAEVFYAGTQGSLAGLDQINLRVPRSLIGRGLANLAVTIEGKPLNLLQVTIR